MVETPRRGVSTTTDTGLVRPVRRLTPIWRRAGRFREDVYGFFVARLEVSRCFNMRSSRTLLACRTGGGGTDSTVGTDCSGLDFRVMELLGVTVPRDADDQFERAPFKSRENWENVKADDLIFFGEEYVTHVGYV